MPIKLDNLKVLQAVVQKHFLATDYTIEKILKGKQKGANGFPVIVVDKNGNKLFLKVIGLTEGNAGNIQFEIETLKKLFKLKNDNVVKLLNTIKTDDYVILVFENINGKNLEEIIEERKNRNEPFTDQEIYKFAKDVLNGLRSIASMDTVHHDIKPKNIMFDGNQYIILDLGIARFREPLTGSRSKAIYKYSSPEQLLSYVGEKHDTISIQSDLFSLGVIMYEMATLHYPFGNGEYWTIIQEGAQPIKLLNSEISVDLSNIISKLMSKKVSGRFINLNFLEECLKKESCIVDIPKPNNGIWYVCHHSSSTKLTNFFNYKSLETTTIPVGVVLASSFIPNEQKLEKLSSHGYKFIVDPETYYLPFEAKSKKSKLKKFDYNLHTDDYLNELKNAEYRKQWIEKIIKHQITHGADIIISPSFLIKNSKSKYLHLNYLLAQDTVKIVLELGINKPILGSWFLEREFISDIDSVDFLISQIATIEGLSGIYLTAESDSSGKEPKLSLDLLSGIKTFVEKTNTKYPVILGYAGVECLPIFTFGLSGAVINMYKSNFITSKLSEVAQSNKTKRKKANLFYYCPGLLNFMEVKEIQYILQQTLTQQIQGRLNSDVIEEIVNFFFCGCPFCKNSVIFNQDENLATIIEQMNNWSESDLDNHYLYSMVEESTEIWRLGPKASGYMVERVEGAISRYKRIDELFQIELKKASKGDFLKEWKKLLTE